MQNLQTLQNLQKTFALKIAYNGGAFSGFAPQKSRNIISVSEKIGEALQSMGIDSSVLGAGRTDKGVHSLGMVVRFYAPSFWEESKLTKILAPKIYPHIKIRSLKEVDSSFCPIKDAKKRAYLYLFSPHFQSPFLAPFVALERAGQVDKLQKCLHAFVGTHNFALFRKSNSSAKTTTRTIYATKLKRICLSMNELALAMNVSRIVRVPASIVPNNVYGVIVDLNDYNVGADKGGAVSIFDDFDIDYNQMKYLIETRCSGALTKPYSAIVLKSE